MKKTLLFSAFAALAMGASAQAVLQDVTPEGYDFSKYEAGKPFPVYYDTQSNEAVHSTWSLATGSYQALGGLKDGALVAMHRWAGDTNDAKYAEIANCITVEDFGGSLGKCLVINQAWSAFEARAAAEEKYGDLPNGYGSGTAKTMLYFFSDPTTINHGWAGGAIRVRVVFNVCRRARHQKTSGEVNVMNAYAFPNDTGVIYPAGDADFAATVPVTGETFAMWTDETRNVDDIPAIPTLAPYDDGKYPDNYYQWNPDRFLVYEFDTYQPAEGEPIALMFQFPTINSTYIIKEVKFFNITNPMDLLDPNNDNKPIPGLSLLGDRSLTYRYYYSDIRTSIKGEDTPTPGMEGDGTEANPYMITTANELAGIYKKLIANTPVYFSLENDIDMNDLTVEYVPANGWDGSDYSKIIMFNGNNHVIKNFTATKGNYSYPSIFGVIKGEVKNLGIVDFNISTGGDGAGILGGYAGHSSWTGTTVIDNVYAIGKVESTSGYAAGLFGNVGGSVKVTNSYVRAEVNAPSAIAGLIGGRINDNLTMENVYASGKVTGATAAGLLGGTTKDKAPAVKNAVVLTSEITGTAATNALYTGAQSDFTNCLVAAGTKVNGAEATGTTPFNDCVAAIQGWDAFHSTELEDGLPILKWQTEAGVGTIEIDETEDAAPVYYNLQGVQVENPANGLYIVKRGNKVTKEIIR